MLGIILATLILLFLDLQHPPSTVSAFSTPTRNGSKSSPFSFSLHSTTIATDNETTNKNDDGKAIHQRALTAKETWSTIALEPTFDRSRHKINLLDQTSGKVKVLRDPSLFEEFAETVKGTYFINGLSSCRIGDRLVHPFEAHGFCKSFVFDGTGNLEVTSKIVKTPLAVEERDRDTIINRGVMSTVASMDNPLGIIKNALSSSERDTANLTADLWPPPKKNSKANSIDPLLIVTTDNGEPYAIDPETLETKGKLSDVVPKLCPIFQDDSENASTSKFLAHTRYDAEQNLQISNLERCEGF